MSEKIPVVVKVVRGVDPKRLRARNFDKLGLGKQASVVCG